MAPKKQRRNSNHGGRNRAQSHIVVPAELPESPPDDATATPSTSYTPNLRRQRRPSNTVARYKPPPVLVKPVDVPILRANDPTPESTPNHSEDEDEDAEGEDVENEEAQEGETHPGETQTGETKQGDAKVTDPKDSEALDPKTATVAQLKGKSKKTPIKPFRFFALPSEIRNTIYYYHFLGSPTVLDLDPDNFKLIRRKLWLFRVSRQMHAEASHYFYSSRSVRLFPTHPGRFFKTKKPLLARLPTRYRACLTSLQLRLGPGFGSPPRGWVVNKALGLQDVSNVRVLKVFVEVDTTNPIFKGFKNAVEGFYEKYSANLLDEVLKAIPSVLEVEFDAYPSVEKGGVMMSGLLGVAARYGKMITWGSERGWDQQQEDDIELLEKIRAMNIVDLPLKPVKVKPSCPSGRQR